MSETVAEAAATATVLPQPRFLTAQAALELVYALRYDHPGCPVVQLMAATDGEGTTSLTWDLALAAAGKAGLRTLLVAVEPKASGTDRLNWASLGSAHEVGTRRVGGSRLSLAQLEPTEQPANWTTSLQTWRKLFDLVLLDSPALRRSSAGIGLAGTVDTSLLVVAAETTRLDDTRSMRDRLWDVGGQTKGCLLNKRRR